MKGIRGEDVETCRDGKDDIGPDVLEESINNESERPLLPLILASNEWSEGTIRIKAPVGLDNIWSISLQRGKTCVGEGDSSLTARIGELTIGKSKNFKLTLAHH